ncbi:hypothetical protein SCFA_1090001 [anaerobic digester metagenome]|jgi:hypothetical protein|uniref:Uncharacterized protein n=1 Tax=anaerobic digester metagenome TaxID=1263854 RepID=A0A485LU95_9ZZZZ
MLPVILSVHTKSTLCAKLLNSRTKSRYHQDIAKEIMDGKDAYAKG